MDTQNLQFTELTAITASVVPDELRIGFWPHHFGSIPQWITLEPQIFAWMDRLCTDYHGGIWNFSTLSNGGAFMAPYADSDAQWHLFNSMNGNGAEMSAEAAGIAVCLIEYSHHACRTKCDVMTEHYYRLRGYALQHPESSTILRIID
ncbi:antirestriction protein [Salmonella enterica subsp. enterica]|nr:antirestriction protein [Salmonella enterica]EDB3271228.1 antirestriction protein [Salmonella enterica subsp. enterica serovar Javiana]EDE9843513.1 antirestriction protein [Salmonella enterica subsp. enterica serovar Javiana]EHM5193771.1 antirestriction protein [Salmonella enterica]ELX6966832.1 antirestriction protein [Salmonella enterica]